MSSPQEVQGSFLAKARPLVLARMATAGVTAFIPLVLARVLSLEQYGTYKQLFLVAQSLCLILPFGMAQSLYFFIPRAEEKRPYYLNSLAFLLMGGAAAGGLILALSSFLARYFSNPDIFSYRWELAGYAFTLIGSLALEVGITSQGKTSQSAVIYLVSDTARAAALIVPVLLGFGLKGSMFALVMVMSARLVFEWIFFIRRSEGPLFDRGLLWQQLLYAAPFGAAMLVAIPQQYAHQYAVSGSVSPEMFALYAVGCFQLPLVDLLYTPTSEVLMVQLGMLEKVGRLREGLAAFREASGKLAFAFFPMSAFLFAAAPEFIGALFGQKYAPAVPIFRVSVLGILLAALPIDGVLRARNETRHIFVAYLVKAVVTAPLVYFGVKRFGMEGGIGSWAIAELIGKAVLLAKVPAALSTPEHPLSFVQVIPWQKWGKALGAALAAAASVFVMRDFSIHAWTGLPHGFWWRSLPLALAGVLFSSGYLVALRVAGVRVLGVLASFRRRPVAERLPSGACRS